MRTVKAPKRRMRQAHFRKKRGYSHSYHADKAQVQALGGILSTLTKFPQIIKIFVQLAPLIRVFMNSFSKSDSVAPALPSGNDKSAGAENTINPVADNESIDKKEDFIEQDQTKRAPVSKTLNRSRKHKPLKRR